MTTVIIIAIVGVLLVALYAIFEHQKNQRMVDNGTFKGVFLQTTGRERTVFCTIGRDTPNIPDVYQGAAVSWQEIIVPVPGKDEASCPRYFTNKYAVFTSKYPGGKGLWARITSVDIPMTTWHTGNPIPAVTKQPAEQTMDNAKIVSVIIGFLRDEKAGEIAMTQSARNQKLIEAAARTINPNYVLMGFAAILVTNILAIYYVIQLNSDMNSVQKGIEHIEKLLGA